MSISDRLRPCPICGIAVEEWSGVHKHPNNDCYLSGKVLTRIDRDAWNTRPELDRKQALLDEAERVVEGLAPEDPFNQDEQGGCVWCGGSSNMWRRKNGDMYAGTDPRDHHKDCAWVVARAWLRSKEGEE